jgi:hypothetical protein
MDMYYLILTNTQRSTVYKADAGTFAQKYFFDEEGKRDCYLTLYLCEAVVIDNFWKKMTLMLADLDKGQLYKSKFPLYHPFKIKRGDLRHLILINQT